MRTWWQEATFMTTQQPSRSIATLLGSFRKARLDARLPIFTFKVSKSQTGINE